MSRSDDPRQTVVYFVNEDGVTLKATITDIEPTADAEDAPRAEDERGG
jgi:hypothetical protein